MAPGTTANVCIETKKTDPVPEQFEMYNLTEDPTESRNLANSTYATAKTRAVQKHLAKVLAKQVLRKLLRPNSDKLLRRREIVTRPS